MDNRTETPGAEIFWNDLCEAAALREDGLDYLDAWKNDGGPWQPWHDSTYRQAAEFNEQLAYLADMGVL